MQTHIDSLNNKYNDLSTAQAEYLSMDTSNTRLVSSPYLRKKGYISNLSRYNIIWGAAGDYRPQSLTRGLDEKKKSIMNLFADCIKIDVTLNNYIARNKMLGFNLVSGCHWFSFGTYI